MDDLISRQAAIDAATRFRVTPGGEFFEAIKRAIRKELEALPSAKPEIIACGDCEHWICHDRRCRYWNHGVKPLDWCCHAERREDG